MADSELSLVNELGKGKKEGGYLGVEKREGLGGGKERKRVLEMNSITNNLHQ